eukprot:SAG22_NODE_17638_length_301_cov_1.009901_1_plen_28_part_01
MSGYLALALRQAPAAQTAATQVTRYLAL